MIKSEEGKVELCGPGIALLADLSCMIAGFKRTGFPEEMIIHAVETAFKNEELDCDKGE